MNLTEWRGDPSLIDAAEKHLKTKTMKAMMEVLTEERPSTKPLPILGASGTDHAYANGLDSGWCACVTTIKAMAVPMPGAEDIIATFSDENKENYDG